MSVGPDWPGIPNPLAISEADHEAHKTKREDFFIEKSEKYWKPLMKIGRMKPHAHTAKMKRPPKKKQ